MSDTRTRILNSATQLFLEGGMSVLSVRAISRRAGMSTIGIYSHFDGKQGILDALYIEGFERVAEAMDVADSSLTPVSMVLQAARSYLRVADEYGAHYRLIFGESSESYEPSEEAKAVAAKAFSMLVKGVGRVLPSSFTDGQRQREAIKVWAIVHGFVGLKNHAVAQVMDNVDWNSLALQAVENHLQVLRPLD